MSNIKVGNLGEHLAAEYGEFHQQDLHIDYFYLRLGREVINKKSDVVSFLNKTPGGGDWTTFEIEWPEFLIGRFPKKSASETEREREERLNAIIQHQLVPLLDLDPKDPSIIISRVCKYTPKKHAKTDMTRSEIAEILERVDDTEPNPGNTHLDYFYLVINSNISVDDVAPSLIADLNALSGSWRRLTPEETWPQTFIGYFPRLPSDNSERAREERLSNTVRLPIRKNLEDVLQGKSPSPPPILLTRACKCM